MKFHRVSLALLGALVGWVSSQVHAGVCCPKTCAPAACSCQTTCQYVEKTVLVPQMVLETRKVKMIECRPEVREETVMVHRLVPETKAVQRECVVMVPETRTRTETCLVPRLVWKTATKEVTVMVARTKRVQGTRRVCKLMPVQEMRTICVDQGHWEERTCEVACPVCCCRPCTCTPAKACAPATVVQTCKVWVPNIVQKQVQVTCLKPVWVDEPCERLVTVCQPERRTCTVRLCQCMLEKRTRTVQYTVCVPKRQVRTEQVTVCKCVAEPQVRQCTVLVPHEVEKEVQVAVFRMVPKTVKVPVCLCPTTACCH